MEGKIEPRLADAYASGITTRVVQIQYTEDPVAEQLPACPAGQRMCPARTKAIEAYTRAVEEAQACVVARIMAIGGEFIYSSPVGNLTSARLSHPQLLDIASLIEVRRISDAEAIDFPD